MKKQIFATINRRKLITGAAGLAFSAAAPWASAQANAWPLRPVRLLVNFPPGSSPDLLARTLAQPLQVALGQPVVIENRAGANGLIGGKAVVDTTDGHTFLVTAGSTITNNPHLYTNMPFDVARDLMPVAALARITLFVVVRSELGVRSVSEFVSLLKSQPGKLSYGSAGNGSGMHLAGELFKNQTGTFAVHVPYRGAPPAMQDLLAGQIDFLFDPGLSLNHVRSGRLVMLAVSTMKRSPAYPDVMTLNESGLPGFDAGQTHGVYAPTGTRPEVINMLNAEINRALLLPAVRTQVMAIGADPSPMTIAQFSAQMESDSRRYAQVIQMNAIKVD